MGGRDKLIKKLTEWFQHYLKDETNHKKRKYILIIAVIGILLILISNLFSGTNKKPTTSPDIDQIQESEEIEEVSLLKNVTEIETNYEKSLQTMLNQIKGVSEAEVMINVDSTNVQVYEKDLIVGTQTTEETDKNGGTRNVEDETRETKLVYVRQGDQEVPVLVQTKKPEVRGVFVIAEGVDDMTTKKWIIESVSKVLDVPTYRISVMPK